MLSLQTWVALASCFRSGSVERTQDCFNNIELTITISVRHFVTYINNKQGALLINAV